MTSNDLHASADIGLLSPTWAGTPVANVTGDAAILQALLDAELGLATAGAAVKVVPDSALSSIRTAVRETKFDLADLALRARAGGNPVIPLVEDLRQAVKAMNSDVAFFVHFGATSQDIMDSALMLVAQRGIHHICGDLDNTVAALTTLADRHRATPMAARTLTQHSVPTTFGLKAAGWLVSVASARNALRAAATRLPAQLGGAAGTLASFHEIAPGREIEFVERYAAELGLATPVLPWHTTRAPITTLAETLVGVTDALGKVGVDLTLLSRTEVGELREATGGGSSSMPQKTNPARSILINAATRTAPGLAAELHRSAIAVDERPDGAWHAEWQTLRDLLRNAGGAASLAAKLLPGLQVDKERMRANLALSGPLIVSERVNIVVGPILGTEAVKKLIAASANDPASLADRLQAELPKWSSDRIRDLLDPVNYLGASYELIDRAIAHVGGAS